MCIRDRIKDIDPKGLDTAFWGSVSKEDIYEYLYFLNRECGNKKSSTARLLASLHGFYDYLVNQVNKLIENPTASIKPPKQDKVLPKYLTAEQSMDLLESTQYQSDFPERDYCMVVLLSLIHIYTAGKHPRLCRTAVVSAPVCHSQSVSGGGR